MDKADFKAIGLKAGLEVHQQLCTQKLFCSCPSKLCEGKPDFVFERTLRPVVSEAGEKDKASLERFERGYTYEYEFFKKSCCLVECDEEPPKKPDQEAMETALKIALMCKAKIFECIIPMRKIVIDGSDVSGFQRTMLIAENGKISLGEKEIGIQSIVLEEDSARPVSKQENKITYSLDRLGIPLIEIATAPEIETPLEAKQCALKIGEMLRRTCKAKRGLGTIRQDLNISIKEGARVEIKGVQELGILDKYVESEAKRQLELIKIKKELRERRIEKKMLDAQPKELNNVFRETECKILRKSIESKKSVFGIKLRGFKGILGREIQAGGRFGTEIADYLKARHGIKGLFHSDELPKYGVSEKECSEIKKALECSEKDAFAVIAVEKEKAGNAINTVLERCITAIEGVPEETRDALENGNSKYSRPLPGAARMYPETDVEKIKISDKCIKKIKEKLPLEVTQRITLYKKHGLSNKLVEKMKLSNHACFFEEMIEKGFNAKKAAVLLLEDLRALERKGIKEIEKKDIVEVLKAEEKGFTRNNSLKAMEEKAVKGKSIQETIKEMAGEAVPEKQLEETVKKIIEKNHALVMEKKENSAKALMGDVMKELRGKADAKTALGILSKEIEKKLAKNN